MFGKMLRVGKGGHGLRYKIDVQVTQLENLPTSIRKCRVVWARSAKMQITDVKDVRGSVASFKQSLTQVTTMYRDKSGKLEAKEYEFKVQVPGKTSSDSSVTIGKATMDMAKYCRDETTTQNAMLPITFKVGGNTTGYLKMVITTIFLGDSNEDGLTEVSGLTGLTSDHGSVREQDLEGFVDDEHAKFAKKSKNKREDASAAAAAASTSGRSSAKQESQRRRKPLPPTAEEEDSDLEDQEQEPPAAAPPAKSSRKKSHHHSRSAPQDDIPEEPEEEQEANPFAKKVAKAPAAAKKPAPKVWEDDEDISPLNSDVSDSETPPPKAKKSKEPEESFDDMKSALFATKKTNAAASAAAASASAAAAGASNSRTTGSKASKVSLPPPVIEEDDESLRNDLFSAKPKAAAAAPSSKSGAGKAAAAAEAAAAGAAAAEAAAPTHTHSKHRSKHAAVPPPPPPDYEDEEEYDEYGPSTSAAPPPPPVTSSKSRGRTAEVADAAASKGSSGLNRPGSGKAESSKGGSAMELDELRQRVSQLEKQLADEQAAKDDLSRKMQKYVDKIADLEDQLAEGDVTELYTQMREMEAKHLAEMKEMETKYQAEIKELMERHLAEVSELEDRHEAEVQELRAAAAAATATGSKTRGVDAASAEELKRLQSELRDQDALFRSRTAKLEAEQAAAIAARQAAESKLSEANKMIDDSLLVATRHQQENKVLHEEVSRLKRQLEDASAWETGAAVAAVTAATAAANNGRRGSDEDDELEELREKLEELQEENARLQKLVPSRARGSRSASDSEDGFKKRVDELQAANRKLEAVCHDLEDKAQAAQERAERLHADLETSQARVVELEATVAALQKRLEEDAGPGGRQAKEKMVDLESRVARLAREKAALEEQVVEERTMRQELEDTLKDKLDRDGDDEAAETVAAFEVKYNRLKERYKMLEESSQEELDELQDQLTEALGQVTDLQRQVKQLQSQLAQNGGGRAAAAAAAAGSAATQEELRSLRSENERVVQQLVAKTMELAELSESEITVKRELARLHEVNMKLAQKATTLEAQVAMAQTTTANAKAAKPGRK